MIHLFYGEESYLLKKELDALRERVLSKGSADFNRDVLDGKTCTAEDIIRCAETLPMMGEKRLVVVYDADALRKGELESLAAWLLTLPVSTELVFVAAKIDGRVRFWQDVLKVGVCKEFLHLKVRSLPAWVADECERRGRTISKEAAFFVATALGVDLGVISSALEKVFLYIGDKKRVELDDVEGCISDISIKSIFELTNAIGEKDRKKCLDIVTRFDMGRGDVLGVLGMVSRHFRILLKVRSISSKGFSDKEAARRLGVPHYFVRQYMDQAKGFSYGKLKKAFGWFYRTDWALKSSPLRSEMIIEKLIWDLTG